MDEVKERSEYYGSWLCFEREDFFGEIDDRWAETACSVLNPLIEELMMACQRSQRNVGIGDNLTCNFCDKMYATSNPHTCEKSTLEPSDIEI